MTSFRNQKGLIACAPKSPPVLGGVENSDPALDPPNSGVGVMGPIPPLLACWSISWEVSWRPAARYDIRNSYWSFVSERKE